MTFDVGQYLEDIKVEDIDHIPIDDAEHDASYICLCVPGKLLKAYAAAHGLTEQPDACDLWVKTGLVKKLENHPNPFGHEPLADILEHLNNAGNEVWASYQDMTWPEEYVRLSVIEIPLMVDEDE